MSMNVWVVIPIFCFGWCTVKIREGVPKKEAIDIPFLKVQQRLVSTVSSHTIQITEQVPPPTISVQPKSGAGNTMVLTLNCSIPGSEIYYAVDNSDVVSSKSWFR